MRLLALFLIMSFSVGAMAQRVKENVKQQEVAESEEPKKPEDKKPSPGQKQTKQKSN